MLIAVNTSFQLTRLMRGVTMNDIAPDGINSFQLTRLMRGVTIFILVLISVWKISTHTPHARRDRNRLKSSKDLCVFQLTRLMRGVTWYEIQL